MGKTIPKQLRTDGDSVEIDYGGIIGVWKEEKTQKVVDIIETAPSIVKCRDQATSPIFNSSSDNAGEVHLPHRTDDESASSFLVSCLGELNQSIVTTLKKLDTIKTEKEKPSVIIIESTEVQSNDGELCTTIRLILLILKI